MENGTVAPLNTKDRGLLDCLHDAVVLLVEWDDLHDLVHLVPQLGGRHVLCRSGGRLACSSEMLKKNQKTN